MPTSSTQHQARIDSLMEQASIELVERRYFEAEQTCLEALRKAHAIHDYDRMARIMLPLQESRRQKRDMAIDAGRVFTVQSSIPEGKELVAGCYLVVPPRVGIDGRALREIADKKHVPVVIVVREPTTREGLWPVVAVGPSTMRTKVKPPAPPPIVVAPPVAAKSKSAGKNVGRKAASKSVGAPSPVVTIDPTAAPLPSPEWFVATNEALGDAALAAMVPSIHPSMRVERLIEMLITHPDHEKLHQHLEAAARVAARDPNRHDGWCRSSTIRTMAIRFSGSGRSRGSRRRGTGRRGNDRGRDAGSGRR